jgi:2,3-diketo-5-methylthio-1-phosphopentane phosphatase
VTIELARRGLTAVLLDIEGTTTPIAFVHDVLFSYARTHLRDHLERQDGSNEIGEVLRRLRDEHAADVAAGLHPPPLDLSRRRQAIDSTAAYLTWLMDRDRKSPALKLLQGHIWERGYQAGELRGQVYDDVAPALRRWRDGGVTVAIYSSGSELAQRRLFESTMHGDLTPLFAGFFDTAVGAKVEADSYRRIARALDRPVERILFVSDVSRELRAARDAGLAVVLSLRPGNAPQGDDGQYDQVTSFDEIR